MCVCVSYFNLLKRNCSLFNSVSTLFVWEAQLGLVMVKLVIPVRSLRISLFVEEMSKLGWNFESIIWISFHSQRCVTGQHWSSTSFFLGCGGLLHVDRGSLSTPHYPQNYSPHLNCSWHVMVTPGFRVSATFQSPFQVQGYGTHCSSGDYLEVMFTLYNTQLNNHINQNEWERWKTQKKIATI